jgi:hypothetical protein
MQTEIIAESQSHFDALAQKFPGEEMELLRMKKLQWLRNGLSDSLVKMDSGFYDR